MSNNSINMKDPFGTFKTKLQETIQEKITDNINNKATREDLYTLFYKDLSDIPKTQRILKKIAIETAIFINDFKLNFEDGIVYATFSIFYEPFEESFNITTDSILDNDDVRCYTPENLYFDIGQIMTKDAFKALYDGNNSKRQANNYYTKATNTRNNPITKFENIQKAIIEELKNPNSLDMNSIKDSIIEAKTIYEQLLLKKNKNTYIQQMLERNLNANIIDTNDLQPELIKYYFKVNDRETGYNYPIKFGEIINDQYSEQAINNILSNTKLLYLLNNLYKVIDSIKIGEKTSDKKTMTQFKTIYSKTLTSIDVLTNLNMTGGGLFNSLRKKKPNNSLNSKKNSKTLLKQLIKKDIDDYIKLRIEDPYYFKILTDETIDSDDYERIEYIAFYKKIVDPVNGFLEDIFNRLKKKGIFGNLTESDKFVNKIIQQVPIKNFNADKGIYSYCYDIVPNNYLCIKVQKCRNRVFADIEYGSFDKPGFIKTYVNNPITK